MLLMILTMAEPEIAPAVPASIAALPDQGRKYQIPAMEVQRCTLQLRNQMIEG